MLSSRVKLAAVVESHADERETQRRVRDLLHAHPRLKGVYISASHALPVLRSAGHEGRLADLTVVATDLSPELLPWIRSGKVAATIYQRPLTQGQIAVQLLYRYLQTRVLSTPLRQIVAPYAVMNSNLNIVLQRLDIARDRGARARASRSGCRRPRLIRLEDQRNSRGTKSCRSRRHVCHSWSVPGDS